MPKLICMLRVKDGIIFIDRWLENIGDLVDEIVVVDNGSSDGTCEKIEIHPKVTAIEKTVGFHEGRDRQLLLQMAQKRNADWLLGLDVDEIFEERVTRSHFDKMMNNSFFKAYGFRRFHLLKDENHYSATFRNLIELSSHSRYLFRNTKQLYVRNVKIHCGVDGIKQPIFISPIRILHLCSLYIDYRLHTYENYKKVDPTNNAIYNRDMNFLQQKKMPLFKLKEKLFTIFFEYMLLNIVYFINYPIRKIKKIF
jgi:glycosyltransferase involved in cell wall biosynthesis